MIVAGTLLGLMVLAVLFGTAVYRRGVNVWVGTVVALIVLVGLVIAGGLFPVAASYEFWLIFSLVYSFVAAVLPVWVLLQPRDYLSMYLLVAGLSPTDHPSVCVRAEQLFT